MLKFMLIINIVSGGTAYITERGVANVIQPGWNTAGTLMPSYVMECGESWYPGHHLAWYIIALDDETADLEFDQAVITIPFLFNPAHPKVPTVTPIRFMSPDVTGDGDPVFDYCPWYLDGEAEMTLAPVFAMPKGYTPVNRLFKSDNSAGDMFSVNYFDPSEKPGWKRYHPADHQDLVEYFLGLGTQRVTALPGTPMSECFAYAFCHDFNPQV